MDGTDWPRTDRVGTAKLSGTMANWKRVAAEEQVWQQRTGSSLWSGWTEDLAGLLSAMTEDGRKKTKGKGRQVTYLNTDGQAQHQDSRKRGTGSHSGWQKASGVSQKPKRVGSIQVQLLRIG